MRIDGTQCRIESLNNTEVVCETGPHSRTVETEVVINKIGEGNALPDNVGIWEMVD